MARFSLPLRETGNACSIHAPLAFQFRREEGGERAPTSLSMKGRGAGSYFPSRSLLFPPSPRLCRVGKMHIRFTYNPFHVVSARVCVLQLDNGAQKCIGSILILSVGLPTPRNSLGEFLQRKFAALFRPSETSGWLKKLTRVVGRSSVTTGKAVSLGDGGGSPLLLHHGHASIAYVWTAW